MSEHDTVDLRHCGRLFESKFDILENMLINSLSGGRKMRRLIPLSGPLNVRLQLSLSKPKEWKQV